jgi:hypothetical protein
MMLKVEHDRLSRPTGGDIQSSISIAMCTYNGGRYLREQLESIQAQSRSPLELVVCDDGSTDNTIELLQSFADEVDFPVSILKNPVQLGSTRNFDQAIRLCRGEYIALSDQDDRWHPEKLARLGAMMDARSALTVVFSDARLIDGESRPTGKKLWQAFRFVPRHQAIFRADPGRVLMERPVVTGATMMFRRSLLQHFSHIPAIWVHDGWITWMSALWGETDFLDECLTDYRIHASQQLGVGKVSLLGRINEIRRRQTSHYLGMAQGLVALLDFLELSSPDKAKAWEKSMRMAISFFYARATAPVGFRRVLFLLRNVNSYRGLSGELWRAWVRDLLMSTAEDGSASK